MEALSGTEPFMPTVVSRCVLIEGVGWAAT